MKKIRVLIVDDSALVRKILTHILESDPDIQVIHAAKDPYEARDYIVNYQPDVITLDIEMPKMDGITFLKKYMKVMPTPTIIISSIAEKGKAISIQALESGAVDIILKPKISLSDEMDTISETIISAVKNAAKSKPMPIAYKPEINNTRVFETANLDETTDKVIAIGASTGGVEHLARILPQFSVLAPGMVVVQHMPEGFTASFAQRLNKICSLRVKEAEQGDRVLPGTVLIAPGGDKHMSIQRHGGQYIVHLEYGEKVTFNRPAVDVLFDSIAKNVGRNAVCVLMTGMGKDGAKGLFECKLKGAKTIIQNEQSCIVFGMPGEAKALGAVDYEVDLLAIPDLIFKLVSEM